MTLSLVVQLGQKCVQELAVGFVYVLPQEHDFSSEFTGT